MRLPLQDASLPILVANSNAERWPLSADSASCEWSVGDEDWQRESSPPRKVKPAEAGAL